MSHSDECRIVSDYTRGRFSDDYKASVHQITWFGRTRWEVRAWKRWRLHSLQWSLFFKFNRKYKTPEAAHAAANKWLDRIEANNDTGECV